ncbi:MAG: hypothetical protein RLZZ400_413 [Actinomycetota bacterium]
MVPLSEDELDLPLARAALDRDAESRENSEFLNKTLADPNTRVLAIFDSKVLLRGSGTQAALRLLPVSEIPGDNEFVYLGKTLYDEGFEPAGTPIVYTTLSNLEAEAVESDDSKWIQLRRTGFGLSDRDAGLFAQAVALSNWHATHRHCPRCGAETLIESSGWVRRCPNDDTQHFPRTDPAIIVGITDDQDRILLGSQGVWEENRWSILAGFVEPGESLTAAVRREMREEAGIEVTDATYLGSQSWPFPYSLMLGFSARAVGDSVKADGVEIEKLRWFSREELAAEAHEILLPTRLSIARAIIERWYGQKIDSATELS